LESLVLRSRAINRKVEGDDSTDSATFWLHILAFTVYNAILGYLFREISQHGIVACLLFFFAFALHFAVNDLSLSEHHKETYDKYGRWLLAGAIVTGAVAGQAVALNAVAIDTIRAFMTGAIILNILKEEIPEQRENCFGSFITGLVIYSTLILLV
jgi:undecaprenyl pyrophosphate phosphatase UppP